MNKKLMWTLSLIFALLPLLLTAVCFGSLPQEVPMHWGLQGEVGYESKAQLWLMAGLSPVLFLLLRFMPRIDPRKKNYQKFQGLYDSFCLVMTVFLLAVHCLILSESFFPGRLSVEKIIIVGVGGLFVFLGNLMPKVKNNFFMGVRTPWTLSDPDVWNRSNRLAGQCFFWLGLVLMAAGLALPSIYTFILTIAGALTAALLPIVMSYIWYQKKQGNQVDKDGGE